jgi:putative hydrolase of the HAD superfamily
MRAVADHHQQDEVATRLFVFDVGGVFIRLAPERRREILSSSGNGTAAENAGAALAALDGSFRLGLIDEQAYIKQAAALHGVTPADLARAETEFLLSGDPAMTALVRRLRTEHRVVALSNTNALHWQHVSERLLEPDLFHHSYVSHETRLEKPDLQSYQALAAQEAIDPQHIVFIDDSLDNVNAARSAGWGLCIHHMTPQQTIDTINAALQR